MRLLLTTMLVLVGCPKKGDTTDPNAIKLVHPDLHCIDGTRGAGKPPPMGHEVWCHKGLPNGTWIRHGPSIKWHGNEQRAAVGEYAEGVVGPTIKIAMLGRPDQRLPDDFFENMTVNRGMRLKIFDDRKKAVAWLQG